MTRDEMRLAPKHDASSRTDELLRRYVDGTDRLTDDELLELAAAVLDASLAKRKYRHVAMSTAML